MIGRTLAHYEVTSFIGKGGMGEVYRARDTKLDRDVALKVLPVEVSGDRERAARFDREAKTLASLNHSNIAQIYGLEDVESVRFLAMEFVEGEDLAERLKRGAIEIDEAIGIATSIAAGLDAAHRKGVVHRDLKPANIKITPDGEVKILDFGLARAYAGEVVSESDPAMSPTITQVMTLAGTILGSAAYMSPEQARGRRVDKRADLWAFGVILYEMLGGRRMFDAGSTTDTLAAVLRADIDFEPLPTNTPPHVLRVLKRCLQRDVDLRQRDAGDVRLDLLEGDAGFGMGSGAQTPRSTTWKRLLPLGVATGLLIGAGLVWFSRPAPESTAQGSWKAVVLDSPFFASPSSVALRRDGRQLVYSPSGSEEPLLMLDLDGSRPRSIPGTEGGDSPAYSPDGEHIVYLTPDGIFRSNVDGNGRRQLSHRHEDIASFVWSDNDTIYSSMVSFGRSQREGVIAIPALGGEERVISRVDLTAGIIGHFLTDIFPDQRSGLMTKFGTDMTDLVVCRIDLLTGETTPVGDLRGIARWSSTGHILTTDMNQDALLAIPYSLDEMKITGAYQSLVQGVGTPDAGAFGFAISREGTLVYGRAALSSTDDYDRTIVRLGAEGFEVVENLEGGPWADPRVSPDGRTLLLRSVSSKDCDLWTLDLASGGTVRVTFEGDDHAPLWLPDGRLVYVKRSEGDHMIKVFDRVPGPERKLAIPTGTGVTITDVTPDGRRLIVDWGGSVDFDRGIYALGLEPGDELEPWLVRDAEDKGARISPDGTWIAHESSGEGRSNVYLRLFDDIETVLQVSSGGGGNPFWSRDGTTLYFEQGDALMACDISTKDELRLSPPRQVAAGTETVYVSGSYRDTPAGLIGLQRDRDAMEWEHLTVLVNLERRLAEGR